MRLIIVSALLLSSCGWFAKNEDTGKSDSPKLADVQAKAETYIKLIGDPYRLVARCDSLTHVGHYNAAAKVVDIYKHRYSYDKETGAYTYGTGWLHRSKTPCNTNLNGETTSMASRSEVSKENVLAFLHNMITLKDNDTAKAVLTAAQEDSWCFAHGGDDGYNCMTDFGPLFSDWIDKINGTFLTDGNSEDAIAIPQLSDYRGNVLGSYLLLKGRAFGYMRGAEIDAVETLVATVPTSPLYHAILHRFTDGDQSKAISLLLDESEFPADKLPLDKGEEGFDDPFGWGDHKTSAMLYVWTTGVLSGI